MKKTIKINLSGNIFHIDEDAYDHLKKYLDAIGRHFSGREGGEEILNDIEARIAELFQEKRSKDEEVITRILVVEVIEIMGDPEEIINTANEDSPPGGPSASATGSGTKRLYRDPENSVIGGVCGGLGAYFNVDPLLFRILFIVLFFLGGASILVYIILWIVLPRALTAAQKLEMRGEPVTVSNIEKKIREEYESAREHVKTAAKSEPVKKTKKAAGDFLSEAGKILLVIVKVILIILGTVFVLSGIGIIIGIVAGAFVGMQVFPLPGYNYSLGDMLAPFTDPTSIALLVISLTLLFLIPVIAMIYGLIKLIFSIKTKNRGLAIGASMLWIVSLLMTIGILAMESSNYSSNGVSKTENGLSIMSDTVYISVNESQKMEIDNTFSFNLDSDNKWFISKNIEKIYGQVEMEIDLSGDESYMLEIKKHSKGRNRDDAVDNAANLNYHFVTNGNKVILNPFFFIERPDKWRYPRVEVTIEVPEGKYIHLDDETREIIKSAYHADHLPARKLSSKTWIMTRKGLVAADE